MKVYDITRRISSSIAIWPGDELPALDWSARIEEGSSVNIGVIRMSTHTGTHVDAPLHYQEDGRAVDDYPLDVFIGPARVIDLREREVIRPNDVSDLPPDTTRLLVRTRHSAVADDQWQSDITVFAPEAIHLLGRRGVRLIGTDAPSFDPVESEELPAHHALAEHGIANIENLQLTGVPEGDFQLVALPLKLHGMDAAPLRAVLIEP